MSQPLLVLHFLHWSAQPASQTTLQQLGILAQTQLSQLQPMHDRPCTAVQPECGMTGSTQFPLKHTRPAEQLLQYAPHSPQAPAEVPPMQELPLMHPKQQVAPAHLPPGQPLPTGRLDSLQEPEEHEAIWHAVLGIQVPQAALALPQ